jgi:hypothetical protein
LVAQPLFDAAEKGARDPRQTQGFAEFVSGSAPKPKDNWDVVLEFTERKIGALRYADPGTIGNRPCPRKFPPIS